MNLPNWLTLSRIAAVPGIVALLYFPGRTTCLLAMLLFCAASITDFLDGYIARSRNLITDLGKFLDPLADKLLMNSVMIMLCSLSKDSGGEPWIPAWVVIIIVAREFVVTGIRILAADMGVVMAADIFGKLKTVFQIAALIPLITHYPWFGFDPAPIGRILLYIALVLTMFSGANYLRQFMHHYRNVPPS
ncbi:MAG: CDP-diacylglycerol--glycerol-3-phosphate 3-phosphatidyltransferase [Desulfovibrio sp.]|nr:MAG: CDP-diacylglycerol--glycerol-3-phosphate 3-phosphatidyltransferase [Desulfovibrio sp.]